MSALRRQWGAVPIWALVLAVVVLIATTLDIRQHGAFYSFDQTIARHMADLDLRHDRWQKWLTYLLTLPGQRGTVLALTVPTVLYLTWQSRSVTPLVRYALALVLMTAVIYALKDWIARPAPAASQTSNPGDPRSYPSGHVANAVLVWGVVWWSARELDPRALLTAVLRWISLVGPVLVAVGMTLLNYHWVSDYVGGAAAAVILLAITTLPVWRRWSAPVDERLWRVRQGV